MAFLRVTQPFLSLESPVGEEATVGDFLEDEGAVSSEEVAITSELGRLVRGFVDRLPDREAEIIRLRFGIGTLNYETP